MRKDLKNENLPMYELIKSMISLTWAMSLFGVKQLADAVGLSAPVRGAHKAEMAFNSVTHATEEQLGNMTRRIFATADLLQRGLLDFAWSAPRREAFAPRAMVKMGLDMLQQSAGAFRFLSAGQDSPVVWQEFKNKLQVFDLFEHVDSALRLNSETPISLADLVEKASALGPYLAVWATEGVGHYYAETCWEQGGAPRNPLVKESVEALPSTSLIALHAGMGLSFANRVLATIRPQSPSSKILEALQQFAALCRHNSLEGYAGAAYESLGLVARNLYPQMVLLIDQQLFQSDEALVGYFWHGVGRAIYFAPTNFLPCGSSPWRAVEMSEQEPPHELGRRNALAGLSWAHILVNIRHPEILETLLKHHGERLSERDAFSNGVMSSLLVWRDSTQDDPYIARLCQHHLGLSDPDLVDLWESQISKPCEEALQKYYSVLKEHGGFGELFRYQSLPDLIGRLKGAAHASSATLPARRG